MHDWTEIAAFDGIDLSESFVLSWVMENRDLLFNVDFVLIKAHPEYQEPQADEWACFRRGTLRFPNARSVMGLPLMSEVRRAVDAAGEIDYGHFDSFLEVAAGQFKVTGDFGAIALEADSPQVWLQGSGSNLRWSGP